MKKIYSSLIIVFMLIMLSGCARTIEQEISVVSLQEELKSDVLEDVQAKYENQRIEIIGIYEGNSIVEDEMYAFLTGGIQTVSCLFDEIISDIDSISLYSKIKIQGVVDVINLSYITLIDCEIVKVYETVDEKITSSEYSSWDFDAHIFNIVEIDGTISSIINLPNLMIQLEDPNSENEIFFVFSSEIVTDEFEVGDHVTITGVAIRQSIPFFYAYAIKLD